MAKALVNTVDRAVVEQQAAGFMQANEPTPRPAAPPPTETLSPEAIQQDMALEYDSMVFLSEIEQLAVRLCSHLMPTSPALALVSLVDLANRIVQFVEQLPMAKAREFSLEALMARDLPNYAQLGLQHVLEHRFSGEALGRTLESAGTLYPISKDILRVLNTCLAINVKALRSSEMRQQWKTVYSGFLTHLAKALQTLDPDQSK